uniref:Skp1-related protein n=1 Tax=Rhabditophanes sp. KR3021 TaxID=114890 RepID=A0AC35UFC9_9BILA
MSSTCTLPVMSVDKVEYDLTGNVVKQSGTLSQMVSDLGIDLDSEQPLDIERIELNNCSGHILKAVIEWAEANQKALEKFENETEFEAVQDELAEFNDKFVNDKRLVIFELILAANYLDMKDLFTAATDFVSETLRLHDPEKIREMWGLENDFDPEDIAEKKHEMDIDDPNE